MDGEECDFATDDSSKSNVPVHLDLQDGSFLDGSLWSYHGERISFHHLSPHAIGPFHTANDDNLALWPLCLMSPLWSSQAKDISQMDLCMLCDVESLQQNCL